MATTTTAETIIALHTTAATAICGTAIAIDAAAAATAAAALALTNRECVATKIGRHAVPMAVCQARHQRTPATVDDRAARDGQRFS